MVCANCNVRNGPSTVIEHPRKFPVRVVAQFPDEERVFTHAHKQQRIGGELHDFVRVHEIAGGEVLGFAQGSFRVFDHHVLFALSAGFVSDGFAAHRFGQHIGGVIIVDPEGLQDTGIRQERPRAGPIEAPRLVDWFGTFSQTSWIFMHHG